MRTLQVIEKLVIIIGVLLALFPLWAWIQETEDRAVTRSAMRLAAYEYCFRILTNQQDLVLETLNSAEWTPAAIEAAAYADEIAEEECALFQELAEARGAAPPPGETTALLRGEDFAPPAARPETAARGDAPGAPSEVTATTPSFEVGAPLNDSSAPLGEAVAPVEGAGAAPRPATAPLQRGDYVILDAACGGQAIALGARRAMCWDGAVVTVDENTLEPTSPRRVGLGGADAFERMVRHFTD